MSRYRQLMSEALNQVRAFEDADYLKPRLNPQQIANIKKVFSKKKASDITQSVKDMIKKMDIPTQLAIKQADIPHLSKLVEEEYLPEFNDAMIKTLKKEYEPMRGKTISVTNANKLGALFTRFDSNKNALEKLYGADIPFISTMAMTRLMTKHGAKAADLNKIRKEELDLLEEAELLGEGTGTIKGFRDNKEKSNMVSLAKQHGLKVKDVSGGIELSGNMRKILDMQLAAQGNGLKAEEVAEGRMSDIDAMRKAGASAAEIAKELKLDVKAVKAILGEDVEENAPSAADMDRLKKMGMKPKKEEDEEPKKEEPKDDKEKLKAEIEKKDDEIAMLKTKAETEKAKVAKKETEKLVNPETGEPLLQIGVAYKHLKDKMKKEEVEIQEFKKMTVTFNDMDDMKKASTDLAKKGFTINAKGLQMKVDGKGADLNKYATDLKNFYKAKVIAEGKYTRYSDLLIQLGRMKQAGDKQGERNTQREIDKEKRKLGIKEADLSKSQIKMVHKKADDLPKKDFKDRYGKDGDSVRYATATNIVKKKLGIGEDMEHPAKAVYEQIAGLKKKADKSGMPYSILKKVYDRGMAAWRGGHRPGTTQQQWAFARVNSFVTKSSGTWGGADKDLAKQVKGS